MKRLSIVMVLCSCFTTCRTPYDDIPIRDVNFTISINATNLIHTGGYEYFTGGISGIVIYRFDISTLYAYDSSCYYDWAERCVSVFDLNYTTVMRFIF